MSGSGKRNYYETSKRRANKHIKYAFQQENLNLIINEAQNLDIRETIVSQNDEMTPEKICLSHRYLLLYLFLRNKLVLYNIYGSFE